MTLDQFCEQIKATNHTPDTVTIDGENYTMTYYDLSGECITYGRDGDPDDYYFEVITSNRYGEKKFSDAFIESYNLTDN